MFPQNHTLAFEAPEEPGAGGESTDDFGMPVESGDEWTGPSYEEWQTVMDTNAQLAELIEAAQAEMNGGVAPGQADPNQPLTMAALQEYLEERDREVLGPIYSEYESRQMSEGEERAIDIIADIEAREGEFLFPESSRQMTRERANYYLDEAERRYGSGPKAAEAALNRAYKDVVQYEKAVGEAYHERRMNEARGLRQAPQEPRAASREQGPINPERAPSTNLVDLVRDHLPRTDGLS